jgi:hypothetical protein
MTEHKEMDADPIQKAFAPLIGLPAWLVRKGHASCLTFEFGQPHLKIRQPIMSPSGSEQARRLLSKRSISPRGEWHLWIYCCHWRVLSDRNEIAWSESPEQAIVKAARELDGLLLTKVSVDRVGRTSEFAFESETTIQMWPYDEDDSPQWMLFTQSGDVLTYRADGLYSLGPSNQPADEEQWQPLP